MVNRERMRRISGKILQTFVGANFDDVSDFFLNAFHLFADERKKAVIFERLGREECFSPQYSGRQ
jgi:hypothetical protein